ncbi:MAG: MFS transporter [Candidatus Sungbacteria bacterium]|nr:MFS transporter [Candidatus Sungbacteria bacterium]
MESDEAKKPTRVFGLSRNVLTMGGVSFLNDLSSDMVFPFIPIFLTSVLGAGATFVGAVEGGADAAASIVKVISGRLSDRWKIRKPLVVAGYSLSAIAKPLLALAVAPWHVLGVRFADRVGKGLREAPRDALISFSAEKKDIGRAFGFHRAADTFGAALGPLVAFLILPFIGNNLRTLFMLSFIASLAAVLVLQIFVREVKNVEEKATKPVLKFKFLGVPFLIFLVVSAVFSLGKASEAFLLLRAGGVGVTLMYLPLVYMLYTIVFALSSGPAGILSDRIGHRNTFMVGMLIFSTTYFFLASVVTVAGLLMLFAVYGFYSAFTDGVGRAIVADLVGEEYRATAYGMYNAITGIALLPGSLIFGILWDRFGPAMSFYYGASLGIAAFVIFLFLRMKDGLKKI